MLKSSVPGANLEALLLIGVQLQPIARSGQKAKGIALCLLARSILADLKVDGIVPTTQKTAPSLTAFM